MSVEAYSLPPPIIPGKSALALNVTLWDDAAQAKMNEEPKQIQTIRVIESRLASTKESQIAWLVAEAAKEIELWLREMQESEGWFNTTASETDSPLDSDADAPDTPDSDADAEEAAEGTGWMSKADRGGDPGIYKSSSKFLDGRSTKTQNVFDARVHKVSILVLHRDETPCFANRRFTHARRRVLHARRVVTKAHRLVNGDLTVDISTKPRNNQPITCVLINRLIADTMV